MKALCRWPLAAAQGLGDAVDRELRVAQVLRHVLADAVLERLALRARRVLAGKFHQGQPHQLDDQLARAARRSLAHGGQLQVGVAHGLERHARDAAAAAHAARHQVAQRQAGCGELVLGQHHDQVVAALGVGHRVVGRGVVERPAAGAHRGFAPALRDLGQALPGRDDLQRFGGKAGVDAFTELRWITVETTPRHYPF